MSRRRIQLVAVPPIKLNTAFIGATLMVVGGVFIHIASSIDNDTLGITGVGAALAGLLTSIFGSLLSRNPSHQAPDKQATFLAIGIGTALLLIAVLVLTASLTGIAFILAGIAAPLINLSDYLTRPAKQAQGDNR